MKPRRLRKAEQFAEKLIEGANSAPQALKRGHIFNDLAARVKLVPFPCVVTSLCGYGFEISFQQRFSFTFKIHKHDAVAEFGMAGDDETLDDDGIAVEPEGGMKADTDWEWLGQPDIAAA